MIKVSRLVLAALFLLLFSGMSFGQEMGAGESGPGTGGIGGSSASMNIDPSIFGSSSSTGYSSSSTGGTDWSKCTETVFIGTAGALKEFASRVNGGETSLCGKLTADINLDGNEANQWTPIGIGLKPFVGTFDGQGHTVGGLYVNSDKMSYVGLFGFVGQNGVVTNVGVVDSYFKGYWYVGGVVGKSEGNVSNVYNTGTVNGDSWVGGIVGYNTGSVSNVYNTGAVNGDWWVGGIVGYNTGTISNMYNTGTVSGTGDYIGGVVGENNDGSVSNVYNTGAVSGAGYYVGGVAGLNNDGTVSNGFFNTKVTCENCDVVEGTTGKSSGEFADGTVAMLLHGWCEKDGDVCKEGGLNGAIWGQDVGLATGNDAAPTLSGVLKIGPLTVAKDAAGKDSAAIDGASELEMKIPAVLNVPSVTFKRSFAVGYSTMMLPFSVSEENLPDGLEFYSFDEVEEIDGKYTAKYTAASVVEANKPYIVKNSGKSALSQVTFEGEFTLKTDFPASSSSSNGWEFKGTYAYKTWEEGDAGLGRTYGFAANDGVNDESIVGQFAKIGVGAYIYPMRAYLEYTAPAPAGRPAANGVAANAIAGNANTVASLPDEIEVVIVEKGNVGTEVAGSDDASGEQTTRVIGTLNTRTGEFKFANDRWFDLQGRYLGNKKPAQKGAYYNNGKKVIVK